FGNAKTEARDLRIPNSEKCWETLVRLRNFKALYSDKIEFVEIRKK
ncbi:15775_t:CDS:1, partial [Entrophospora sp. SA101]